MHIFFQSRALIYERAQSIGMHYTCHDGTMRAVSGLTETHSVSKLTGLHFVVSCVPCVWAQRPWRERNSHKSDCYIDSVLLVIERLRVSCSCEDERPLIHANLSSVLHSFFFEIHLRQKDTHAPFNRLLEWVLFCRATLAQDYYSFHRITNMNWMMSYQHSRSLVQESEAEFEQHWSSGVEYLLLRT